jgi:hypothetical protein
MAGRALVLEHGLAGDGISLRLRAMTPRQRRRESQQTGFSKHGFSPLVSTTSSCGGVVASHAVPAVSVRDLYACGHQTFRATGHINV